MEQKALIDAYKFNKLTQDAEDFSNNVKSFSKRHERIKTETNLLQEENKMFSKSFNYYIKERDQDPNYTQKIFGNLLMDYVSREYKVTDLTMNSKLFASHPLLSTKTEDITAFYKRKGKVPRSYDRGQNYINKLLRIIKEKKTGTIQSQRANEKYSFTVKHVNFFNNFKNFLLFNFKKDNKQLKQDNKTLIKLLKDEGIYHEHYKNIRSKSKPNTRHFSISEEPIHNHDNNANSNSPSNKKIIKPTRYRNATTIRLATFKKGSVYSPQLTDITSPDRTQTQTQTQTQNSFNIEKLNQSSLLPIKEIQSNPVKPFSPLQQLKIVKITHCHNNNTKKTTQIEEISKKQKEAIENKITSSSFQLNDRNLNKSKSDKVDDSASGFLSKLCNVIKRQKSDRAKRLNELFTKSTTDYYTNHTVLEQEYKDYLMTYKNLSENDINNILPKDFVFGREFLHYTKTLRTKVQEANTTEKCKTLLDVRNSNHRSYIKQLRRQDKRINALNYDFINTVTGFRSLKKK